MKGKQEYVVRMIDIWKHFPGVVANAGVTFELKKGEIHTLLGENGAGKSTLMNILSGLYQPDKGRIIVKGKEVEISSPKVAISLGIGMIYQHFMLVDVHTVWENMLLGLDDEPFFISKKKVIDKIARISKEYGLAVDPQAKIWQLSVGERQRVEILRMLYRGADILILDEPTSVLTPQEAEALFSTLRKLVKSGCSIVFISHKLDEVMEISDRITILRNGKNVAVLDKKEASKEKLAELMVGKKVVFDIKKGLQDTVSKSEVILRLVDVSAKNDRDMLALKNINLEIKAGQILGLAGIAGNGQQELCEVIVGLRNVEGGKILFCNRDITKETVSKRIEMGISYIPADRLGVGLVGSLNVADNSVLKNYRKPPICKRGWDFNKKHRDRFAETLVKEYSVFTPNVYVPVRNLSGGNMQRLLLAREFSSKPKLLVAFHPTWGLDVGATEFVRKKLIEKKQEGMAILLISEDLEEILSLSDKIAVIYRGKITGVLGPKEATERLLGLLMTGSTLSEVRENNEINSTTAT